jgi:hypothetical protein
MDYREASDVGDRTRRFPFALSKRKLITRDDSNGS